MLAARGLLMRQGTIVDATIIAAPASTKNKQKMRDPEIPQTKKGNQWHFGMPFEKLRSAYRGGCRLRCGPRALRHRGQRGRHYPNGGGLARPGESGLCRCRLYWGGAAKRPEHAERAVSWNIAVKRGIIKALPKALRALAEPEERALAQVRAWVEHLFHIVKNLFGHKKLRYRGLAKNTAQLHILFALANLMIVKKTLLAPAQA